MSVEFGDQQSRLSLGVGLVQSLRSVSALDADQIVFTFRDQSSHSVLVEGTYAASFDLDTPPTQDEVASVTFEADRTVKLDLPMPPPFANLTLPMSASRAQDMTISWSPPSPADQVVWYFDISDCVYANTQQQYAGADNGMLTIRANTFQLQPNSGTACGVEIKLLVVRDFEPDPAFESGTVRTLCATDLTFSSTP
jgi:hypothetical protein